MPYRVWYTIGRINVDLTDLTLCRSSDVIRCRGSFWIDMNSEIYFALPQRIYRIRYSSDKRLTLTLCSV